jgi:hypothetical protein
MKEYLIKVNRCPHCAEELHFSSESSDFSKTMRSIFILVKMHRSKCFKSNGKKKLTSVSIKEKETRNNTEISEYKTNKILF